jgi:hypothetical protein
MRVCFFARVSDKRLFERMEFYKQDIDILRELGYEVAVATSWCEIPLDVDFYFLWWWQWGFLPAMRSAFRQVPIDSARSKGQESKTAWIGEFTLYPIVPECPRGASRMLKKA